MKRVGRIAVSEAVLPGCVRLCTRLKHRPDTSASIDNDIDFKLL